jgi:uncharacterized protein
VAEPNLTSMTIALRRAMTRAMKDRDRAALAAYRTALAAIDNAAAVPLAGGHRAGAVEQSPVGVGQTDAERRSLTEQDMTEIVRAEVQDRRATADSLAVTNPAAAQELRLEASLLADLLDALPYGD